MAAVDYMTTTMIKDFESGVGQEGIFETPLEAHTSVLGEK